MNGLKEGMLWFDNTPKKSLVQKIDDAMQYFTDKYGRVPNACHIHPTMLGNENIEDAPVEIKVDQGILPFHFWIGVK